MATDPNRLKEMLKRLLLLAGGLFLLALLFNAIEYKYNSSSGQLAIIIEPLNDKFFITDQEVADLIKRSFYGEELQREKIEDLLKNETVGRLNLKALEQTLDSTAWVLDSDVYVDARNNIKISITQRTPVLRIFDKNDKGFYLDKNGKRMPVSKNASARVLVASGSIEDETIRLNSDSTQKFNFVDSLLKMALYIQQDTFLNAQVEQIYVNRSNEMILIPKVGDHEIVFGGMDKMENKFRRLKIFYREGMPNEGWRKYRKINLKYSDQVIGVK